MIEFDIDDSFEEFMRKANPLVRETSSQYKESRRVFWAGAAATFLFMTRQVPTVSEDEGVKLLEKLKREIEDFVRRRVGFSD